MFIKTPNESGDDAIGYLPSDVDNKLEPHFKAMKGVNIYILIINLWTLGRILQQKR